MMNAEGRCSLFQCQLKLPKKRQREVANRDVCETVRGGFVRDKLQLETVLGESNPSWFESLTEQRLERKCPSKSFHHAVFDSPSSPTISQLINVSSLTVGNSPKFSCDSPLQASFNSYTESLVHTPDNWTEWQKPLVGPRQCHYESHTGNAEGDYSPSRRHLVGSRPLSHPSSTGVHSLGALADDSNLSWTNSLATPPRELSDISTDVDTSTSGHKELARVLFSPGNNLDTTDDSVQPLDSTYEEDQPTEIHHKTKDQTDHSEKHQTDKMLNTLPSCLHIYKDKIGLSKIKHIDQKSSDLNSLSKPDSLSENISGFAEISCESENEEMGAFTLEKSLSKNTKCDTLAKEQSDSSHQDQQRLVESNSSAHNISVHGDDKKLAGNADSIDLEFTSCRSGPQNTEVETLSPTFTQKCSRKCFRAKTKERQKKRDRRTEISVDEALSDFFDSPATAVRRRGRRSKSDGIHLNSLSDSPAAPKFNVDSSEIKCSTPKERTSSLQSILSSSKKRKSLSSKKVTFSESVKKYSISSEYPSILKKGIDKDEIKAETKKVKFEEVILSYKESKTEPNCDIDRSGNQQKTVVNEIDETGDCLKAFKCKAVENKDTFGKNMSAAGSQLEKCSYQTADSSGNEMEIVNLHSAGDGFRGSDTYADEFSQISPSSLNEMCSVADQSGSFISCDNDIGKPTVGVNISKSEAVQGASDTDVNPNVKQTTNPKNRKHISLRFMYPSKNHTSSAKKIFHYEENSQTLQAEGLVRPVLASHIVSPQTDSVGNRNKDIKHKDSKLQKEQVSKHIASYEKIQFSRSKGKTDSHDRPDDRRVSIMDTGHIENDAKNKALLDEGDSTCSSNDAEASTVMHHLYGATQGFHSASGKAILPTAESLDKASRLLSEESNSDENRSSSVPKTGKSVVTLGTLDEPSGVVKSKCRKEETDGKEPQDVIDFSDEWMEDFDYDPLEPDSNPEQIGDIQNDKENTEKAKPTKLANGAKEGSNNAVLDTSIISMQGGKNVEYKKPVSRSTQEGCKEDLVENLEIPLSKNSTYTRSEISAIPFSDGNIKASTPIRPESEKTLINALNVSEFSGFKSASGKKFECSIEAIRKAQSFMNDASEESITMKSNSAQQKPFVKETKSLKINVNQEKHKTLKEDEKINNISNDGPDRQDKPDVVTSLTGFSTASGKTLAMSDVHIRKARSVLGEILEENKSLNNNEAVVMESGENNQKLDKAERLKMEFEKELFSGPSDMNSMMEELRNVKTNKAIESSRKTVQVNDKVSFKTSTVSVAQNVPKGFRPFKPPRPSGNKNMLSSSNKYPDSKSADWGGTDSSVLDNGEKQNKANCDKTKNVPKSEPVETGDKMLGKEKANTVYSKKSGELVEETSMVSENCSDLYQGLSQIFAEELDSSFERINSNSLNTEKEEASLKEVNPTGNASAQILHKMSFGNNTGGFATASGKSLTLSTTSLLSAKKLFDGMEDNVNSIPQTSVSETHPDSDREKDQDFVALVEQNSKEDQPVVSGTSHCDGNVLCSSNERDGDTLELHSRDIEACKIINSNTKVFTNSKGLQDQIASTSFCKMTLNTSIASLENDSVGRQEHMDDKDDNELLSSIELKNPVRTSFELVQGQGREIPGVSDISQDKDVEWKPQIHNQTPSVKKDSEGMNNMSRFLHSKDDNGIYPAGFQTASGKHIEISEKAFEESKRVLKEEKEQGLIAMHEEENTTEINPTDLLTADTGEVSNRNQLESSIGEHYQHVEFSEKKEISFGFKTAKGMAVSMSHSALEAAMQRLNKDIGGQEPLLDVNYAEKNIEAGNIAHSISDPHQTRNVFCGFQTASGKLSSVSHESIEKAKKSINGEFNEGGLNLQANHTSISDTHENDKDIAAKQNDVEVFSVDASHARLGNMFQTASGKAVKISDQALTVAKRKWKTTDDVNSNLEESCDQYFLQSPSAAGKRIKILQHHFQVPEQKTDEKEISITACVPDDQRNSECFREFVHQNTHKDKSGEVNELMTCEEVTRDFYMKNSDESDDMNCQDPVCYQSTAACSFQTASGKKVDISKQALKEAKKTMNDNDEKVNTLSPVDPFKITSGVSVENSEKTASFSKTTLEDFCPNEKSFDPENPFQTASGNAVKISSKALALAGKSFEDTEDKVKSVSAANLSQTASGNIVKVSDKSLALARRTLEDTDDEVKSDSVDNLFKTESENAVKYSDKALAFTRKTDVIKVSAANTFQTASGNAVKVSDMALANARNTLEGTNNKEKSVSIANTFQTASGNIVKVSDSALVFARKALEDTEDKLKPINASNPFQTASGNVVKVSDKALTFARKTLDDHTENMESFSAANPFKTASGNVVKISDKALTFAKKALEDKDAKDRVKSEEKQIQSTANSYLRESDDALSLPGMAIEIPGTSIKNFGCSNAFQTASGSTVKVSDKAVALARKTLDDTEIQEIGFNPFRTSTGSNVTASRKSLALVRKRLIDNGYEDVKVSVEESGRLEKSGCNRVLGDMHGDLEQEKATSDTIADNFEEEILNLRMERDRQLKDRMNKVSDLSDRPMPERETIQSTEQDSSGLPVKRQKLENGMEKAFGTLLDRGTLKRKPLKTRPEGTTTDRRHPGFRPFIPVRCKVLQKSAPTLEGLQGTNSTCGSTRDVTGLKPTFHTPYRTSGHSCQAIPPTSEVKVTLPIFRTKSVTEEKHEQTGEHEGEGEVHQQQKQQPSMERGSITGDLNSNNATDNEGVVARQSHSENIETKQIVHSGAISEEDRIREKINGSSEQDLKKVIGLNNHIEAEGKLSEDLDIDMASYSQEEDDVFYCTLVEARRQQEKIIKNKGKVKPMSGRLYEMKQTKGRWQLKEVIKENSNSCSTGHVKPLVCAATAGQYRFCLDDHYRKHTAHVLVGDGAFLVPDDAGCAGKAEFYRAFLTLAGVDSKLISEAWLYNHYKWIVWKLATYEVCLPAFSGRCLTPEMVMLQLKYRYDREIDMAQRSAIRKIFERDDTASKRMVLCVAGIQWVSAEGAVAQDSIHGNSLDSKVVLQLTDGWYSIKALTDIPLADLILRGKVCLGQKICISGAEVTGGDNACSPLEAPDGVMLKICSNSSRPCAWDSTLGYQRDPRPLCVPLCGLYGEGGAVGMVDVVIVRKYPIMYMEKLASGSNVFRTSRCEEKMRQEYESKKETTMQKLYQDIMAELDKEKVQETKQKKITRSTKKWTQSKVEGLTTGQEIYEGLNSAQQQDTFQSYLSEHQLNQLYEYQRHLQEERQMELNSRLQAAWTDRQETAPDRNVTPVLKFRIAGCSRKDMDKNITTILTVWRPAPEISDLQEGKRYRIYSLNASTTRSKYTGHTVQLTATKQTKFRLMLVDENFLDNIYEPREVLWVSDVKRRKPSYGELDFVGLVVKVVSAAAAESSKPCDTVYLADCQSSFLAVKVWNGFKSFGEDLFTVGNVLFCCNLIDKSSFRSQFLPTVEAASEFTLLNKTAQNAGQRKAVEKLNSIMKDKRSFLDSAQTALNNMLHGRSILTEPSKVSTPSRCTDSTVHYNTLENTGVSCQTPIKTITSETDLRSQGMDSTDAGEVTPQNDQVKPRKSVYQAKMARLLSYSSPSCLSPMNTPVPRSVRKGFKPPAFKNI